HQVAMRHLDGDEALQLVIAREVDEAKAAFAQGLLDAVATDLAGRGFNRNGRDWFVNGLVQIVHGSSRPSPAGFVTSDKVSATNSRSQSPCEADSLQLLLLQELPHQVVGREVLGRLAHETGRRRQARPGVTAACHEKIPSGS